MFEKGLRQGRKKQTKRKGKLGKNGYIAEKNSQKIPHSKPHNKYPLRHKKQFTKQRQKTIRKDIAGAGGGCQEMKTQQENFNLGYKRSIEKHLRNFNKQKIRRRKTGKKRQRGWREKKREYK